MDNDTLFIDLLGKSIKMLDQQHLITKTKL